MENDYLLRTYNCYYYYSLGLIKLILTIIKKLNMIRVLKESKKFLLLATVLITSSTLFLVQESDSYSNEDSVGTACFSYYYGNWDMHVGGCWEGTPFNCTGCSIPSLDE